MAPIDPVQLLKALAPLLSVDGGINGIDKAPQFASLMKKFSRKLVSRCVYCNVLKATSTEILAKFLEEGGWNTINTWLNDAKENSNQHFLLEIIKLCKVLPMTLVRLKENSTPKVVKALTKYDNDEIKALSHELVTKWMTIIKGDDPPVEAVKKKRKCSKDGDREPKESKKSVKAKEKDSPVKEKKDSPIIKEKKESKKTLKAPTSNKAEKKTVKINNVQNPEKISRTIEKEVLSRKPGKIKNNKRTSSDKNLKPDDAKTEDVKNKLDEPLPKKLKLERPKTVRSYQNKFRATGLEQEVPLPKKIPKKSATLDKAAAVAAVKQAVIKKLTIPPTERITEKKIKPESLLTINESSNASGGIKLIPAKPQPAHILHESTSFIDALVATPAAAPKRRKKPVSKPAPSPTTPTSPTPMKPPKLQFYNETLELNTEETNNKEKDDVKIKEDEVKNTEEKDSPSSPLSMGEVSEPKIVVKEEQKEEISNDETPTNSVSSSIEKDEDSKGSGDLKDEVVEEERDPNALRSILAHCKRRQKRKSVRWATDADLKEIFYFELDETERVNVLKKSFCDLKSLDSRREREAFEAAKRQVGDKMEESTSWWAVPIYIDIPPSLVVPGCYSREKEIQLLRQQSVLQEIYFTREMVPDSAYEPELEIPVHVEPKIIPLDEGNNVGSLLDYSAKEIPKPKSLLPEVLTSLIKIPSSLPNPLTAFSQVLQVVRPAAALRQLLTISVKCVVMYSV